LQQAAVIGACSPTLVAAWVTRSVAICLIAAGYPPLRSRLSASLEWRRTKPQFAQMNA
jgi:hypothetical protein